MSNLEPKIPADDEIIISVAAPTDERLREDFGPMIEQMRRHYAGNDEAHEWSDATVDFVD